MHCAGRVSPSLPACAVAGDGMCSRRGGVAPGGGAGVAPEASGSRAGQGQIQVGEGGPPDVGNAPLPCSLLVARNSKKMVHPLGGPLDQILGPPLTRHPYLWTLRAPVSYTASFPPERKRCPGERARTPGIASPLPWDDTVSGGTRTSFSTQKVQIWALLLVVLVHLRRSWVQPWFICPHGCKFGFCNGVVSHSAKSFCHTGPARAHKAHYTGGPARTASATF